MRRRTVGQWLHDLVCGSPWWRDPKALGEAFGEGLSEGMMSVSPDLRAKLERACYDERVRRLWRSASRPDPG